MTNDSMVSKVLKDEFHDVRIARDGLVKMLKNDDNVVGTAVQERHGKHSIVVFVKRNNVHGMETSFGGFPIVHEHSTDMEEGAE